LETGEKWGEVNATLHGDLATIVEWTGNGAGKQGIGRPTRGLSVSAKTGTLFRLWMRRLVRYLDN